MRAVAALALSTSLLAGACFPNNATHRTIAKVTEGGVTIGGVVMLAVINTGADCMTDVPGTVDQKCEDRATLMSSVGLGMVLAGLIGFIVTVSTSPDDNVTTTASSTPAATPKTEPAPAPLPAEPAAPPAPPPTDPVPPTPDPGQPTQPTEPTQPTTP